MGIQTFRSQDYDFAANFPELYNNPNKGYDFANTKKYHVYVNYRFNSQWRFGFNHATHSNSVDFAARPFFSQFDIGSSAEIDQTSLYGKLTTDLRHGLHSSTLLTLMNYELDNSSYFNNLFTSAVPGYKYAYSTRISLNQDFEYLFNTLEFNYEHWLNPETHLKFAAFFSRISDAILRRDDTVPDHAIAGADLQKTFTFDNVDKSDIYGLYFNLDNQMRSSQWRFKNWFGYSYLDGSVTKNGQKTELPMMSPHKLTAGATISYYKTYLLTPMLYWIGKAHSNQPNPADSSKMRHVPAYFIMNLHREAKLSPGYSLKLDIYNLFDETYSNAPFPPEFSACNEAPQPGRLTAITLYLRFK